MGKKNLNISDLDKAGRELAKLKLALKMAKAKADDLSAQVTEKQDKYINMMIKSKQDSWVIKGVGRLTLVRKKYTNVVDYPKFVKWANTPAAKKYGMDMELVNANTKVSINSKNGLGEIMDDFKTATLSKKKGVDFGDLVGVDFAYTKYITYSKSEKKK